jgi:hypothetical protein
MRPLACALARIHTLHTRSPNALLPPAQSLVACSSAVRLRTRAHARHTARNDESGQSVLTSASREASILA